MPFALALAMRSSGQNCYPDPGLAFCKLIITRVFSSGGVFFHRHRYLSSLTPTSDEQTSYVNKAVGFQVCDLAADISILAWIKCPPPLKRPINQLLHIKLNLFPPNKQIKTIVPNIDSKWVARGRGSCLIRGGDCLSRCLSPPPPWNVSILL